MAVATSHVRMAISGPTYNSFEISPNATPAGPGTVTTITGDDIWGTIAIPFRFRFYGATYTSVWAAPTGS